MIDIEREMERYASLSEGEQADEYLKSIGKSE